MLTEKTLIKIIAECLKISQKKLTIKSKIKDIEEWDSLGHLSIFFAIDKKTNGAASKIKNLNDSKSIKEIHELLKKNKLSK